ncbi:30S ribosomal protein THX [Oleiagrimonas sp. C23AA]|nr:30S ribosomal protein THX [Oleiagrimonas sp. C23AA]NII10193.1 30S ribosomal protein THX [Oleiagrimonas sp. C23AA]
MGKGDRRTARGKIYRGSYGRSRPHSARTTVADKAVVKGAKKPATRRKSA